MLKERKLSELYLYLCIVAIVSFATSILVSLFSSDLFEDLTILLGLAAMVAEVVLVFVLRGYNDHFKKAFVLIVIAYVISLLASSEVVISDLTIMSYSMTLSHHAVNYFMLPLILPLALAITTVIIELVAAYHMFSGHSEILMGKDYSLAAKWKKLFGWRKIATIVKAVSIMIAFLSASLGLMLSILTSIALIAIQCLEIYYLYKTHEVLGRYETKENVDPDVIDVTPNTHHQ